MLRHIPTLCLLAALTGCTGKTGETGETGETGDPGETAAGDDADGDGYSPPEDCDDTTTSVHPGAKERWNGVDDDCDGVRDADGHYGGEALVRATAVYEGDPYRYTLSCPTTLDRDNLDVTWLVTCTPDPEDSLQQQLLGSTLTVDASITGQGDGSWAGTSTVRSTNGWDASADATLTWTDFRTVALTANLDAASLSLGVTVTLSSGG